MLAASGGCDIAIDATRPSRRRCEVSATARVEVSWQDAEAHEALDRNRDSFRGIVEHAVLLGAPLRGTGGSTTERWRAASGVVAGRLVNCYSPNDLMLAVLFRMQSWAARVAGLAPLSLPGLAVDVDVSDLIGAHADYGLKIREIWTARRPGGRGAGRRRSSLRPTTSRSRRRWGCPWCEFIYVLCNFGPLDVPSVSVLVSIR